MKHLHPISAIGKPAFGALAVLGAWWLSCVVYAASRSVWIERAAETIAKPLSQLLPRRTTEELERCVTWSPSPQAAWCFVAATPQTENAGWLEPLVRIASATPPWTPYHHHAIFQAAILPFHALLCALIVGALAKVGYPTPPLRTPSLSRAAWSVMWRSAWRSALWLALPPFLVMLWTHASFPTFQNHASGGLAFPFINAQEENLDVVAWGAFLGYLGTVSGFARSQLRAAVQETDQLLPSAPWTTGCHACSYDGGESLKCPECGIDHPRAVGTVYWTQFHARLARGRRIDPLRVLWFGSVAVMLTWPLLSGLATGVSSAFPVK